MWYEIFIDDEFIKYFGDENNIFLTVEDGKKILAPTFARFYDIVDGVTCALTMPQVSVFDVERLYEKQPYFVRGFTFCRENKPLPNQTYLADIWKSIHVAQNESVYDEDIEKWSAEQCAALLIYPFWSRMGGSFEIAFQKDGLLKKYLFALKKKVEEEHGVI